MSAGSGIELFALYNDSWVSALTVLKNMCIIFKGHPQIKTQQGNTGRSFINVTALIE